MILNLRGGQQVEYNAFALTDMLKWGYNGLRNVSAGVTEHDVRGVPALHRAVRLRAEALAELVLRCWTGEGAARQRADNTWQAQLFASHRPNPYQTRFGLWETVGESLAWRGNGYVWKNTDPLTQRVLELWALHPDQVECQDNGRYKVQVASGFVDPVGRGKGEYVVGDETVLHVRGHGEGGTYEAPSPIRVFRDAFASPVARQRHERRMWEKGTALQLSVEFPATVSKEQVDEWRPVWADTYEGSYGNTTAVIGGGAQIKPIGMTARDAEFVALAGLTVQDASLIMGVPINLLVKPLGESQPKALEEDLASWLRFGLGPELSRIESALAGDPQLFPSYGRSIYPHFDSAGFVRGDVKTEDDIAHQQIQDGRLLVDEWRESQGMDPLPDGVGKVPQIVPVGGAPNPVPASSNGNGNVPAGTTG